MTGIRFDAREFTATIGALQRKTAPTLRNAGMAAAQVIARHTIKTKLIEANPPFLNRKTGTLVRSVSASPRSAISADRVIASFGSNLDYAYKHEVGGRFDEWIKGHRVKAHGRAAHAQRVAGGRRAWVKRSNVGSHWVRAHSVMRIYRRRRMFATGLNERRQVPAAAVRTAMALLMETNSVPAAGAILGRLGGEA